MIAKQSFTFHDELISGPDIVKGVAGESVILRCDPHSAISMLQGQEDCREQDGQISPDRLSTTW